MTGCGPCGKSVTLAFESFSVSRVEQQHIIQSGLRMNCADPTETNR